MLKLLRRLRYWALQRRLESDLAEEIEFHRALKERELIEQGVAPEDAAVAARRSLGNVTLMREESRAIWIAPWLESVWQDACYAARSLRRDMGFTMAALTALILAIGLNTSLFTGFNAVAFRPWPVHDPSRVVTILPFLEKGAGRGTTGGFSLAEVRYFQEHSRSFTGLFSKRSMGVHLGDQPDGNSWSCHIVSGNYFSLLGVQMDLGRGFLEEEGQVDTPRAVAVLSHRIWQDRFGGDQEIAGKQIRIDGIPFTVVGVASRDFVGTGPERHDLWIPFPALSLLRPNDPSVPSLLRNPDYCCSAAGGRLMPGISREQAAAELGGLSARFRSESGMDTEGYKILVVGTSLLAHPGMKRRAVPVFILGFAAVTLVLLLACANVGNLLLARAAARQREIAVRLSIGAGRKRLIRQLLTESLVLAGCAGAGGVAVAWWLPGLIVGAAVEGPIPLQFTPDLSVLAYTLALSFVTCLLCGLAPALHGTRVSVFESLKQSRVFPGAPFSLRNFLLGTQVAISVVLLVGAGLMVRGVERARTQDPGFAIDDVELVSFDLPASAYNDDRRREFFSQLLHGIEDLEDRGSIGLTTLPPLGSGKSFTSFRFPGEDNDAARMVMAHNVSAGYFDVLRIPIVTGRNLAAGDTDRKTLLINQTMARRYWPDDDPVGKTILQGDTPHEIIGVAKDAFTSDLDRVEPTLYSALSGGGLPVALVRSGANNPAERLTALVKGLDPRAFVRVTPLRENLERWLGPSRIMAALAGAMGLLALVLASVGVFGVFAYVVQQRTREIGIRTALGARPSQVAAHVLVTSSRAVLAGLAVGLAVSMSGSRLLASYLYGLSPYDAITYGAVAALVGLAGIAASFVPARRAAKVDPATALRDE